MNNLIISSKCCKMHYYDTLVHKNLSVFWKNNWNLQICTEYFDKFEIFWLFLSAGLNITFNIICSIFLKIKSSKYLFRIIYLSLIIIFLFLKNYHVIQFKIVNVKIIKNINSIFYCKKRIFIIFNIFLCI